MENQWASENLQVIRTIMERASIYRRALAPIMTLAGSFGVIGAVVPCFVRIDNASAFAWYWMAVAVAAAAASMLLGRRQALREDEPFRSPPTRRVTLAFLPPAVLGLGAGLYAAVDAGVAEAGAGWLSMVWMMAYGCGVHAAGFFMARGIRLLGWVQIACGGALWWAAGQWEGLQSAEAGHYIMGTFFGVLHLAYGIYLYFTEAARKSA